MDVNDMEKVEGGDGFGASMADAAQKIRESTKKIRLPYSEPKNRGPRGYTKPLVVSKNPKKKAKARKIARDRRRNIKKRTYFKENKNVDEE